jgi:predicted NBD/HSP70 family sugar kinase
MFISVLTRKLRKGKTYDEFRKAWYHTVGYGMPTKLYSAINVFDPREVIVVGLGEIKPGQDPEQLIQIEVKERLEHPLEAVIEPEIGRTFGIVVSEDDFSPVGEMKLKPATVNGKETDFGEINQGLKIAQRLLTRAAAERDAARKHRPLNQRQ